MPRQKVLLFGERRVSIPGTENLTVITAIDPMPQGLSENDRDSARMLDGEVGNTATGIKDIRRDNGLGRAYIDTGRTTPTMILDRFIDG